MLVVVGPADDQISNPDALVACHPDNAGAVNAS
jgi:hypothetical protein